MDTFIRIHTHTHAHTRKTKVYDLAPGLQTQLLSNSLKRTEAGEVIKEEKTVVARVFHCEPAHLYCKKKDNSGEKKRKECISNGV